MKRYTLLPAVSFLLLYIGLNIMPNSLLAIPIVQNITYVKLSDSFGLPGTPNVLEYTFDFSYLPKGAPVLDANVRIQAEHTWVGDMQITLVAPNGLEVPIFKLTGCFGLTWPINTILDDEGVIVTQCTDLILERIQPLQQPGISGQYLKAFDGLQSSGIWKIRVEDLNPGEGGEVSEIGIELLVDVPSIAGGILTKRKAADQSVDNPLINHKIEVRDIAPFALFQNEPNPFQSTTMIGFTIPESGQITLTVFDLNGRILFKQEKEVSAGHNMFEVNLDPAVSGIMLYRIDAGKFSATRKMVKI